MGPEMMNEFRAQAERFGTRFITDDADRVELSDGGIQRVFLGDEEHRAKAVILAMGAEPRRLGIPGELELGGRGVSTCGVCDGAFFKGENVAVIGGGDSAMEDSIFISKYANELTIVHRRDEFRASKIMLERASERRTSASRPRSSPRSSSPATTASSRRSGCATPRPARPRSSRSAAPSSRSATSPRSELVAGQVDTDENGYVMTDARLDPDQPRRRLRGRRPRRPHLPPGRHRRRDRLHGRARRRVVPARHASSPEAHWLKGGEPVEVAPTPPRLRPTRLGAQSAVVEEMPRPSRSRVEVGLRPFHEFDEANETWPRGDRPAAIREAAAGFRARFATPGEPGARRAHRRHRLGPVPGSSSPSAAPPRAPTPTSTSSTASRSSSSRTSRAGCARSPTSRPSPRARRRRPSTSR